MILWYIYMSYPDIWGSHVFFKMAGSYFCYSVGSAARFPDASDVSGGFLVIFWTNPLKKSPAERSTMLLNSVSHLFRLGPSKNHGELLVITRYEISMAISLKRHFNLSQPWKIKPEAYRRCFQLLAHIEKSVPSSAGWKPSKAVTDAMALLAEDTETSVRTLCLPYLS